VTRLTLALPGDPDTATGGYRYDRRLAGALAQRGGQVELLSLPAAFPRPAASDLAAAAAALAALPDGRLTLVDGLALGVMPGIAQRESRRLRLLALVHHPLALETGLAAGEARRLADSERRALAAAGRVITTSATTAGVLETAYGVDPARLWVAEPGTDPAPPAEGSGGPGIALLCVATPFSAWSSARLNTALDAPRALKAPAFWKFSHLKKSVAPVMASKVSDVRIGVR